MNKKKERTDILAMAEKLTGIPYQEIIRASYKGTNLNLNEVDERIYLYETIASIQMRVRLFSAKLVLGWKKQHGDFTLIERGNDGL